MTFSEHIYSVIDELRPALQMDGGDIEIISVDEQTGIVQARLQGACAGCALSPVTLKMGIETELKKRVPGFTGIEVADEE